MMMMMMMMSSVGSIEVEGESLLLPLHLHLPLPLLAQPLQQSVDNNSNLSLSSRGVSPVSLLQHQQVIAVVLSSSSSWSSLQGKCKYVPRKEYWTTIPSQVWD